MNGNNAFDHYTPNGASIVPDLEDLDFLGPVDDNPALDLFEVEDEENERN